MKSSRQPSNIYYNVHVLKEKYRQEVREQFNFRYVEVCFNHLLAM